MGDSGFETKRRVFRTELVDPSHIKGNPTRAAIVIDDQSYTIAEDPHRIVKRFTVKGRGSPQLPMIIGVLRIPRSDAPQMFAWWERLFERQGLSVKTLIHHATKAAADDQFPGPWETHIVACCVDTRRWTGPDRFDPYPNKGEFPRHTWRWWLGGVAPALRRLMEAGTLLEAHQAAHAIITPQGPEGGWATWTCPHEDIAGVVRIFDTLPKPERTGNRELTWALSQPCGPPEEATRREVAAALSKNPNEFPYWKLPDLVAELV
mgnify:CR=1 FL=1